MLIAVRGGSQLLALSSETRRRQWSFSLNGRTIQTRPAVKDGIAYIWAGRGSDSRACAVDCVDGTLKWSTAVKGWTFAIPVTYSNVVVFTAARQDHVTYGLALQSGDLIWERDRCAVLASCAGRLVCGTSSGGCSIIEAATGTVLARIDVPVTPGEEICSAADPAGGVAVLSAASYLVGFDVRHLREIWRADPGGSRRSLCGRGGELLSVAHVSPEQPEEGTLLEIRDIRSGRLKSSKSFPQIRAMEYLPPLLLNNEAVVVHRNGISVLDREGYDILWSKWISSVYDCNQRGDAVYIGGWRAGEGMRHAMLCSLALHSGDLLWSLADPGLESEVAGFDNVKGTEAGQTGIDGTNSTNETSRPAAP